MNGAIAELCAKIIRPPSRRSVSTIGIIHQSFAAQRKLSNSPAIENFMSRFFIIPPMSLLNQMLPQHEHIHATTAEGAERLLGRVHNRFASKVERGIQ